MQEQAEVLADKDTPSTGETRRNQFSTLNSRLEKEIFMEKDTV